MADSGDQLQAALGTGGTPASSDPESAQARILLQQTTPEPSQAMPDFLGQLALLYGVPFENLVPDGRMLPPESIRFFYVDVNWIESMVDGAMSTGVHSDRDIRFQALLRSKVSDMTREAANTVRSSLRGEKAPPVAGERTAAGFLMRSAVVSGWPGLEVAGYSDNTESAQSKLVPLRIERLSPDVLLVIFGSVPKMVVLNEPKETLHFGISGLPSLGARDLAAIGAVPAPANLPARLERVPIPFRAEDDTVVRVGDLVTKLAGIVRPGGSLGSGDFAAEMIDPAGKVFFLPDAAQTETP